MDGLQFKTGASLRLGPGNNNLIFWPTLYACLPTMNMVVCKLQNWYLNGQNMLTLSENSICDSNGNITVFLDVRKYDSTLP